MNEWFLATDCDRKNLHEHTKLECKALVETAEVFGICAEGHVMLQWHHYSRHLVIWRTLSGDAQRGSPRLGRVILSSLLVTFVPKLSLHIQLI